MTKFSMQQFMDWCNQHLPLPKFCLGCDRWLPNPSPNQSSDYSQNLCPVCFASLPWAKGCAVCNQQHSPHCPSLPALGAHPFFVCFEYRALIQTWVNQLKYHFNPKASNMLAGLVRAWIVKNPSCMAGITGVLPIPSHKYKIMRRGFDPLNSLSQKVFGKQLKAGLCQKLRHTKPQMQKTRQARLELAKTKNLFAFSPEVRGQSFLVFDDVCTTGTTLKLFCTALNNAGAKKVKALVLSRNF